MKKKIKAFTLTELIVVIMIIALIAAFGIPGYKKIVRKNHERSAVLHLMTIHGANEIFRTISNGVYWAGPGANLAAINTGLSLSIIHDDMNYSYARLTPTTYQAFAAWTSGDNFTVRITQQTISAATNNPCCSAGTCPSLPLCP